MVFQFTVELTNDIIKIYLFKIITFENFIICSGTRGTHSCMYTKLEVSDSDFVSGFCDGQTEDKYE